MAFGNMFYMKRFKSSLNNPASVRAAKQSVEVLMHPEKFVKSPSVQPYKSPAPAPTTTPDANNAPNAFTPASNKIEHPDITAMKVVRSGDIPDEVKHELMRNIIKKHVKGKPSKL